MVGGYYNVLSSCKIRMFSVSSLQPSGLLALEDHAYSTIPSSAIEISSDITVQYITWWVQLAKVCITSRDPASSLTPSHLLILPQNTFNHFFVVIQYTITDKTKPENNLNKFN